MVYPLTPNEHTCEVGEADSSIYCGDLRQEVEGELLGGEQIAFPPPEDA
jgi:hypothetical protein